MADSSPELIFLRAFMVRFPGNMPVLTPPPGPWVRCHRDYPHGQVKRENVGGREGWQSGDGPEASHADVPTASQPELLTQPPLTSAEAGTGLEEGRLGTSMVCINDSY